MDQLTVTKGSRARLVLIVEDDKPTSDALRSAINDERGYRAVCAATATDALDTLGRLDPDLLVLDIRLPGMSGLELYDRIRADPRFSELPIVFETANAREHIAALRERGVATYLKKPFDIDEVIRFMKRLVPPLNGHARRSAG